MAEGACRRRQASRRREGPRRKARRPAGRAEVAAPKPEGRSAHAGVPPVAAARSPQAEARETTDKAVLAEQRKREKARKARQARVADLETRIAAHETAIKALEAEMSAPGFYEQRDAAQAQLTRHQTLMWEVGELMQQWEMLSETDESDASGDA